MTANGPAFQRLPDGMAQRRALGAITSAAADTSTRGSLLQHFIEIVERGPPVSDGVEQAIEARYQISF
jgi:hypothetical protein